MHEKKRQQVDFESPTSRCNGHAPLNAVVVFCTNILVSIFLLHVIWSSDRQYMKMIYFRRRNISIHLGIYQCISFDNHFGFSPYMKSTRKRAPIRAAFSWKWLIGCLMKCDFGNNPTLQRSQMDDVLVDMIDIDIRILTMTLISRFSGKLRV